MNNSIQDQIIQEKKKKGKPKLTEEQKIIQHQKYLEYQKEYKLRNKEKIIKQT